MASRGMGIISPRKMPKRKHRKDGDEFNMYAEGGPVGLYANIHAKRNRIKAGSRKRCVNRVVPALLLPKHSESLLRRQRSNYGV